MRDRILKQLHSLKSHIEWYHFDTLKRSGCTPEDITQSIEEKKEVEELIKELESGSPIDPVHCKNYAGKYAEPIICDKCKRDFNKFGCAPVRESYFKDLTIDPQPISCRQENDLKYPPRICQHCEAWGVEKLDEYCGFCKNADPYPMDERTICFENKNSLSDDPVINWKNAAMRLGEELSDSGPIGYGSFTASEWLQWAKESVCQPRQSDPWVSVNDRLPEEGQECIATDGKVKMIEAKPCPFCGHDNIRAMQDEQKNCGWKYTYCWCKVCGAYGPAAYNLSEDEMENANKCIERWNERTKDENKD